MNSSVLILSSPADAHAQAVERQLNTLGIFPTYWCATELLNSWRLNFQLTQSQFACQLRNVDKSSGSAKDGCIDLTSFTSIWLRRPGRISAEPLPEKWMEAVVERESNRALASIYSILSSAWINPPVAERNARFKLAQLTLAKQCGLSIPETLVTNDPDAVNNFYIACNGQVVYKLIDEASNLYFPRHEVPPGIVTMPLRDVDLEHLGQVRSSLHLFQRRISKVCDVRATVVGRKIFAVRIESQMGRGSIDFRLDYSVPMSVHELPAAISQQCLELMRKMGLTFGAIDLCLDAEGSYYFLEINPSGQWLWMEEALDLPIARELALLLAGTARNL